MLPPREVGRSDVFLDLGSGKGRAVIQAGFYYPFKRVAGVEMSLSLHETAVCNVDLMRHRLRCADVRPHCMDVLDLAIPDGTSVVLLHNPFTGNVFGAVITRLLESASRHPRPMRIIYSNPIEESALLATGRVEQVRALRDWRPGRDWSRSNSSRLYAVTSWNGSCGGRQKICAPPVVRRRLPERSQTGGRPRHGAAGERFPPSPR
jgi:SAM-dependent methyltransferase